MRALLLAAVRGYRYLLSPWWGGQCRFSPTCSEYMYEAIQVYGVARGGWMGMKRIARCNPMTPGGFDPVPPKKEHAQT